MTYQEQKTLFIVVSVILAAFFLFLFFYEPIKNLLFKKFRVRMFYKTVYKATLDHDFYLINQFWFAEKGEVEGFHIDHIVFGDKFIYVIKDLYHPGAIAGDADAENWQYIEGKSFQNRPNPLNLNISRCDRLALTSGQSRSDFISVVLINDDCVIKPIENRDSGSFLVPLGKFRKFLSDNEKRTDVAKFSQSELAIAVQDLAELNQHGK